MRRIIEYHTYIYIYIYTEMYNLSPHKYPYWTVFVLRYTVRDMIGKSGDYVYGIWQYEVLNIYIYIHIYQSEKYREVKIALTICVLYKNMNKGKEMIENTSPLYQT